MYWQTHWANSLGAPSDGLEFHPGRGGGGGGGGVEILLATSCCRNGSKMLQAMKQYSLKNCTSYFKSRVVWISKDRFQKVRSEKDTKMKKDFFLTCELFYRHRLEKVSPLHI